uniref:SJCHGC07906 protein n=1 Tax=Schistosoma japonicum TaxID=6182 RepID=Q5DEF2_SCHJA|nr:SJCHGC07906 protein [Schistosoma japonicum]
MTEDSYGFSSRLEEIQSSIAEGRLMLNVLRSLPTTENNDAFIVRFEDLISRLENYRFHSRKSEAKDVTLQLQTLKEQQDRIQSLLDQTTTSIQDSTLSAAPSVSSNDAQPYVVFADSASALLSKFESLLSNGTSQSYQKDNDQVHSSVNSSCNFRPKQESNTSSEDKDKLPSFNSKTLRSLDCEESTDISTQFNVHLSELQRLIEEIRKIDGMVKRLLWIQRKQILVNLQIAGRYFKEILRNFR